MAQLQWDAAGKRFFYTGTSKGIIKVKGSSNKVEAWNGLTGVSASPSGGDESKFYANNSKYLGLRAAEDFGGTITAYTYPDSFLQCDGGRSPIAGVNIYQQARTPFDLSWQTVKGNDEDGVDHGYEIHFAYNCTVSPTQRDYKTINESPEAIEMSWTFNATPVDVPNMKPTSYIVIDSTQLESSKLKKLEETLYGTSSKEPSFPSPTELLELLGSSASSVPGIGG